MSLNFTKSGNVLGGKLPVNKSGYPQHKENDVKIFPDGKTAGIKNFGKIQWKHRILMPSFQFIALGVSSG